MWLVPSDLRLIRTFPDRSVWRVKNKASWIRIELTIKFSACLHGGQSNGQQKGMRESAHRSGCKYCLPIQMQSTIPGHVTFAHRLQIMHQFENWRIANCDFVCIDGQHLKSSSSHQGANVDRFHERADVWRESAFPLHFGQLQSTSQLIQRLTAEQTSNKNAVRL